MKRFYLILLSVSLLSSSTFAGSMYPTVFLPNADVVNPIMWYGKRWDVRYDFIDDSHQSLVQYLDVTESIVDGKSYVPVCVCERKLIVRGETLRSDVYQSEATRLLYRQEGDKVYYLSQENNAEFLLFDYGLKEGERFEAQDGGRFVVTETGYFEEYGKSIYSPGQDKPRMLRLRAEKSGEEDVWIEGIGSVKWGVVPKYLLKASAVFKDTPIDAHVFRSSTNGDIAIYDYLFNINEENYKLINYELGEVSSKEEEGLIFTFIEDTLCVSGVYCPVSSFGPECIECLVTSDNTIAMAFYGFHVITTNSIYRKIDVKIPGFKPGTYIFGTETLVCKGKNPDENYHPFVEEGKKWECTISWGLIETNIKKQYYSISGDTIVNGITCKKLHGPYFTYAVYEKDGKVYCHENVNGDFHLLYDFTCHEGDVVNVVNPEGQTEWGLDEYRCTIKKVDTIITKSGHRLKRFTLQAENLEIEFGSEEEYVWIEGVGSPWEPLYPVGYWETAGGSSYLNACYVNGEQLFVGKDIYYGTGIEPIQNSKFKVDNNAPVYDLSGRRVINPKRGLYIQGGKRVLVK